MAGTKIVAMFARLDSLSHEEFVARYEGGHVPLVIGLLPPFDSYQRHYISDPEIRARLGFDVITEACFTSAEAYQAVLRSMGDPDIAQRIAEDEACFIDRERSLVFQPDVRG